MSSPVYGSVASTTIEVTRTFDSGGYAIVRIHGLHPIDLRAEEADALAALLRAAARESRRMDREKRRAIRGHRW